MKSPDLQRLRREYDDRQRRLAGNDLYSLFNPAHMFMIQQRQRAVLTLLRKHGFQDLSNKRILEVGCGTGRALHEYLSYGASPQHLHGIDLLLGRLTDARRLLPHVSLACADGQQMPYRDATFDIVLQYTAFSSILDLAVKVRLAREIMRVLRPDGLIVWYDFWLNPFNRETRGIRRSEVRTLFPDCRYDFERITLAPPISRWLASRSWLLSSLMERLQFLNTHHLAAIRKTDAWSSAPPS